MFCPKCGKQNLDTSKFCRNCGKQLPVRPAAGPPRQPQHQMPASGNLLGQVLDGRYRIDAKLGAGAMGDVYKATRLLIGDEVAIKILHAHLASNTVAAQRFQREARTAIQLKHRNIVALYDVGISAVYNVPYLLMELARGLTLRQIIRQNPVLPLEFAVTVTVQICAALEEAHRLGIIHRDIKPENIIADKTAAGWLIKVLDFGIAKLYNQADIALTQDGSTMGTPQYMSPEQCSGEDTLDGRSDIYSAGIVLYEMLCGTVPFKAASASAVAHHQVQTPPPPPRSVNPNIPPQVEAVILRALEKQRDMRQQNAAQLAQELIQAATAAMKQGLVFAQPAPVAAASVSPEAEIERQAGESPYLPDVALEKTEAVETGEEDAETEVKEEAGAGAEIAEGDKTLVDAAVIGESSAGESGELENAPVAEVKQEVEVKQEEVPPEPELLKEIPALETPAVAGPNEAEEKPAAPTAVTVEPEIEFDLADTIRDIRERLKNAVEAAEKEKAAAGFEEKKPEPEVPPGDTAAVSESHEKPPDLHRTSEISPPDKPDPAPESPAPQQDKKPAEQLVDSKPDGNRKFLFIGAIGITAVLIIGAIAGLIWLLWPKTQTVPPANAVTGNSTAGNTASPNQPPPGMAYVPGGEFMMGTDRSIDEKMLDTPAHKVLVKPFFIDLTEVTNEDYQKFVAATNHKAPPDWKNGNYPGGKAKFPVTGVDWNDASAYAKWAGKRLPTEEEWEFAARGTDGRLYPWGNEWKKEFANADKQKEGTAEVGKSTGKSPFGLFDMSGNAWEWTASDAKAYPNGKKFEIESPDPKVIRGGFFGSPKEKSVATIRRPYGASGESEGYANTGFRCVKDVPGN